MALSVINCMLQASRAGWMAKRWYKI